MKIKYYLSVIVAAAILQVAAAQEWQPVSPVPNDFRTDHTFGFGIDGTGYLVTGALHTGQFTNSFYSYEPSTDTWTQKEDFPGPARGFAIGAIYEGKAYLGFGLDTNFNELDDLWVYDPGTDEWTQLASCQCIARTHPAMNIADGKIYVGMGGSSQGNLNDWWEYSIEDNTWTQKASFPAAPRHHPFQFVANGEVYAGFGHGSGFISNEWYKYDHNSDQWTQVQTLPGEGRVAGTQFDHNGMGYILSGDGDDHQSMEEGEFYQYNPANNTWEQMPSHPGKSRWAPASFVVNNEVYLIGGFSTGIGYPSTNWKFPLSGGMVNTTETDLGTLNVFPNPTTDLLHINLDQGVATSAKVYSSAGQLMLSSSVISGALTVEKLSPGIYYLEVQTEAGNLIRTQFTKQ